MAAAEASVNILSEPSLILFVNGIAEEADDIKRYATICNKKSCAINICSPSKGKYFAYHSQS